MILKYISAKGTEYDLKTVGGLRARSADLHTYEWVPDITQLQFGTKVNRFRKEASAYTIKLDAGGTLAQRKQYLNELHAAFDEDIYNKTPGRIVPGLCNDRTSTDGHQPNRISANTEIHRPAVQLGLEKQIQDLSHILGKGLLP